MSYRAKHYLDLRPPLAYGGHVFVTTGRPTLEWCIDCKVILPAWAIKEGMGHHFGLARVCPGLMRMLERGGDDAA